MKISTNALFTIMLVDDEKEILYSVKVMFNCAGFSNVITVNDSREVMALLDEQQISLVVLDLSMPHVTGLEILKKMQRIHPGIPVIVMTAINQIETAVECMKLGALDFFVKPVEESRLLASVARAMEVHELKYETIRLKNNLLSDKVHNEEDFAGIATGNGKMKRIFQYVEAISRTRQPVLITGETGVGKELISRSIHRISGRVGKFVAVNVAGLDDQMFSDTLFGHLRGAYTGAHQKREGLMAQAAGGTIFLDEIGDLCMQSQVKLLRLLQDHEYFPLGSDVPRRTDARVIVATNKNLEKLIQEGQFRQDLYYRFSAHHVQIPPLRERLDDIPMLVDHFLTEGAATLEKTKPTLPPELFTYLEKYDFPGNIRQLQSMIFDAVACHSKGILSIQSILKVVNPTGHITPFVETKSSQYRFLNRENGERPMTLEEAEYCLIDQALEFSGGNQNLASTFLGISRQALNKKISRRKNK